MERDTGNFLEGMEMSYVLWGFWEHGDTGVKNNRIAFHHVWSLPSISTNFLKDAKQSRAEWGRRGDGRRPQDDALGSRAGGTAARTAGAQEGLSD